MKMSILTEMRIIFEFQQLGHHCKALNLASQNRQQLGFKPRVLSQPRIVAPGRMRQWQDRRFAVHLPSEMLTPVRHCLGKGFLAV